jgi:hypothetical protein
VTAPDSPAVAVARRLVAHHRRYGGTAGAVSSVDALDAVLAELDEARREVERYRAGKAACGVCDYGERLIDVEEDCPVHGEPAYWAAAQRSHEVSQTRRAAAVAAERERRASESPGGRP